jgi:hypothetical protein
MSGRRRALSITLVVTFISQLCFGMVIPLLPGHLAASMSATILGTILGVRVISQRVGGVFGGMLTDTIGIQLTIMIGTGLRTAGLLIIGFSASPAMIAVGLAFVGLGGAFFGPALNTQFGRLSRTADERESVFRWSLTLEGLGALFGPLVGAVLISVRFDLIFIVSAVVYLAISVAFLAMSVGPDDEGEVADASRARGSVLGFVVPLRDRRLWLLIACMAPYFFLGQQVYVAVPLQLESVGAASAMPYIYSLSAGLMFVVSGLPRLVGSHSMPGSRRTRSVAGYGVMAAAAVAAVVTQSVVVMVVFACALTLAASLIEPSYKSRVYELAGPDTQGAYFGAGGLLMGACGFLGSSAGGALFGAGSRIGYGWFVWAVFTGLCVVGVAVASWVRMGDDTRVSEAVA